MLKRKQSLLLDRVTGSYGRALYTPFAYTDTRRL